MRTVGVAPHLPSAGGRPPVRARRRRAVLLVAATLCSLLVVVPRAGAAQRFDAPGGFVPAATAWTTPRLGWVLGVSPCGSRSCPVLARTADGGRSWSSVEVRGLAAGTGARFRIAFDHTLGLLTDGTRLQVTRDGGRTWRRAVVAGAVPPLRVVAIAAGNGRLHAVVVDSSATRLHTASPGSDAFTPVPGVELPGAADGEIAIGGARAHVVLAAVHRVNRYWVGLGHRWARAEPPCPARAATELAVAGRSVLALCSEDPGMGRMAKLLRVSEAGGPFRSLGRAPRAGITTGLAAASPSTVVVTAVGRGAGRLHRGADHGSRWTSPLVTDGPLRGPGFTDGRHGAVVRGGPGWSVAEVLLTSDGGVTWTPLDFSPPNG